VRRDELHEGGLGSFRAGLPLRVLRTEEPI
jgi:hypothetical protein